MSSLLKLGTNTAPSFLKQGRWLCPAQHFCRRTVTITDGHILVAPLRGWHRMGDTDTPDVETCRGEKSYCSPPAPQPITALYVRKVVLNLVFVGQGQALPSYCPVSRLIPGSECEKGAALEALSTGTLQSHAFAACIKHSSPTLGLS